MTQLLADATVLLARGPAVDDGGSDMTGLIVFVVGLVVVIGLWARFRGSRSCGCKRGLRVCTRCDGTGWRRRSGSGRR
jgi:hypothetical protein